MMKLIVCFALFAGAIAQKQLTEPVELAKGFGPKLTSANECKIIDASPVSMLVCTSEEGILTAYDPASVTSQLGRFGEQFPSGLLGETGVAFSEASNTIMYGTTLGEGDSRQCRIHAVSATTELDGKWSSVILDGGCSGTPVISSDGAYVFVTHNFNTTGFFTILNGDDGTIFWEHEDSTQPLSPPGIYHNPIFGNYGGGAGNTNDIVVFANKPFDGESGVGNAGMYGFQFPIAFTGSKDGLSVITLRELDGDAAWQAITPPTITDGGRRMYWGVSRSQIRGWPWLDDRDTFDRSAPESLGFARADRPLPKSQPIYAKVATTKDVDNEIIFTGSAKNLFTALDRNFNVLWQVELDSPVLHEAQVSPDDSVVYFVEEVGIAYAYKIADGTKLWEKPVDQAGIAAGYTLSLDGSTLYLAAHSSGILYSYQVAEVESTPAPVQDPTLAPVSPTLAPVSPTLAPVASNVPPVLVTPAPVAPVAPTTAPISSAPNSPAPIAPVAPTLAPVTAAPVTLKPAVALAGPSSGASVAGVTLFTLAITVALFTML